MQWYTIYSTHWDPSAHTHWVQAPAGSIPLASGQAKDSGVRRHCHVAWSAYLLGGGHHISHSRDVGVPPSTSLSDVSHETPTKHYYDRVIGVGGEQSGSLATHTCYVVK